MAGWEPKTLSTFLLVQTGPELLTRKEMQQWQKPHETTHACAYHAARLLLPVHIGSRVLQLTREDAFTVKLRLAELPEAADRSISEDVTLNSAVPSVMLLVTSALVAFKTDLY